MTSSENCIIEKGMLVAATELNSGDYEVVLKDVNSKEEG